jgi:hypothetical protein
MQLADACEIGGFPHRASNSRCSNSLHRRRRTRWLSLEGVPLPPISYARSKMTSSFAQRLAQQGFPRFT